MSAVALAGFIKGLAQGTSKRLEKEREDEETLMLNRMKIAAANKLVVDKENAEIVKSAKDRLNLINTIAPNATEQEKIALASNANLTEVLKKKVESGETINLSDFLVVNKDQIPQDWKTANDYVASLGKYAPDSTSLPMAKREGLFGREIGVKRSKLESMAATYGGKTPEELLAYENVRSAQTPEAFGSLKEGALAKPKTVDQKLELAASKHFDLLQNKGPEDQATIEAGKEVEAIKAYKVALDPKQATWASYVGDLKIKLMNSTDSGERRMLQSKIAQAQSIDEIGKDKSDKLPTASVLSSLFAKAAVNAVNREYGNDVKDDLIIDTGIDGSTSFRYIGTNKDLKDKVGQTANDAIARVASPYLKDGVPLNTNIRTALSVQGIEFDQGGAANFKLVRPIEIPQDKPAPEARKPGQPTQPTFRPTQPTQAPQVNTPAPPAAVDMLRKNPTEELKNQFKAKYGYLPAGI